MPAPKPLPKPRVVAKQLDELFALHDKQLNNRDSKALEMLAEALSVITKITTNPPSTQIDEFHAWDLLVTHKTPHSRQFESPPRMKKWEQDLMLTFNKISFNVIRSVFPSNPHLNEGEKYKANHLIHPRIKVLEEFKIKNPTILDGFFTKRLEDRVKLFSLVEKIIKDAKSKEGRLAYEQHIRHIKKSKESVKNFVTEIFERHDSLQVSRIILMFKNLEDNRYLDYEIIRKYWDNFRRQLGNIECAYLSKLSHSTIRSYHFHLILFFPANATGDSISKLLKEKNILPNNIQTTKISEIISEIWEKTSITEKKIKSNESIKPIEYEKCSIILDEVRNPQSDIPLKNITNKKSIGNLLNDIIYPIFEMDLYVRLIPPKKNDQSKHGDRTYWKGGEDRLPLLPKSKKSSISKENT